MRNKPCMTAADVRVIAEACRAEAARLGLAVSICIVDDAAQLLHFERLDARPSTIQVALAKARTAALMRLATGSLEGRVRENPLLRKGRAAPAPVGV